MPKGLEMCELHCRCYRTAERDARKTGQVNQFSQASQLALGGDGAMLIKWLLDLASVSPPGKQGKPRTLFEYSDSTSTQAKGIEASTESTRTLMLYEQYMEHFTEILKPPRRLNKTQATAQWTQALNDPSMKRFRQKVHYFNGSLERMEEAWAVAVEENLCVKVKEYKKDERSVVSHTRTRHASKEKLSELIHDVEKAQPDLTFVLEEEGSAMSIKKTKGAKGKGGDEVFRKEAQSSSAVHFFSYFPVVASTPSPDPLRKMLASSLLNKHASIYGNVYANLYFIIYANICKAMAAHVITCFSIYANLLEPFARFIWGVSGAKHPPRMSTPSHFGAR